jgi:hypothetical protein
MDTFDLDRPPPYIALSYAWGDKASATSGILLNGQAFKVTSSLYTFLDLFRSDPASQEVSYIWIVRSQTNSCCDCKNITDHRQDQICINQSDDDERSYSVRFMWAVYKHAAYVVVWLGDSQETETAAKTLAGYRYPHHQYGVDFSEALVTILSNRYFTRLWIIQELLLARSVIIHCRETWGIPLEMVQALVQAMEATIHPRINNSSLFLLWDSIYNREGRHLTQCIERYCHNGCQDPRDKVYALLGLVKAEEQVPIDYKKSVAEVYVDTVQILARRWWLQTPHTLDDNGQPTFIKVSLALAQEMFPRAALPGLYALFKPVRDPPTFKWYIEVFQYLSEHENIEEESAKNIVVPLCEVCLSRNYVL